MDKATLSKSRPTTAKLRIEIDLAKPLIHRNPLYILHQELKSTSKALSIWSTHTFGDISEEPKKLEIQMRTLEENFLTVNNVDNRNELYKCRADYTRYLKLQDSILRQKARAKWIQEGDTNTAYFHAIIKDKRRRLSIKKITDEQD